MAEGAFKNISGARLARTQKPAGYTQVEIRAPHSVDAGMEAAQMWRHRR